MTTFSMLPDPIRNSESESLSLLTGLPLLGVPFLDHLLELVHFLALLHKKLLCGIGFLSASLSGAEIRFFHSVFLKMTAISNIVRRERTPMFLAKVTELSLGLWDYCQYQVASYPSYRCAKLSCREKRWISRNFPGHIHA